MMQLLFLILYFCLFDSYAKNSEPDWLPPARKSLQLSLTLDGLQYGVEVRLGTPSTGLFLVLDTGYSGIVFFNQSICDSCYDHSFPRTPIGGELERVVDGEAVKITKSFYACNQMNVSVDLVEVPAHEVLFSPIGYLLGNKISVYGGAGLEPIHKNGWGHGILGASYIQDEFPNELCISSFWDLIAMIYRGETLTPIISLDLFKPPQPSTLYLGGIHEPYREQLIWSAPAASEYALTVYDLTVCDSVLQSNIGNNSDGVQGTIDSGASCLTLPAEIFDLVVAQLPVSCGYANENEAQLSVEECGSRIGTQMFYLPDDAVAQLPTLNFRLDPEGPWLHLSLTTLILERQFVNNYWPDNYRKPLCLYRGAASVEGGRIEFGSLALRSFFVSVNMESFQVGFANKLSTSESTVQCVQKLPCEGMQLHNKAVNICEDPQCHLYYFFTFDESTKTCQLSLSFHAVAIFVILSFLIIELGMNEAHKWLSARVMSNIEETM